MLQRFEDDRAGSWGQVDAAGGTGGHKIDHGPDHQLRSAAFPLSDDQTPAVYTAPLFSCILCPCFLFLVFSSSSLSLWLTHPVGQKILVRHLRNTSRIPHPNIFPMLFLQSKPWSFVIFYFTVGPSLVSQLLPLHSSVYFSMQQPELFLKNVC